MRDPITDKEIARGLVFDKDRRWYRAIVNTLNVAMGQESPPEHVEIKDETLREGIETPGVLVKLNDKLEIAEKLTEMGIRTMEVGHPGGNEYDFEFTKQLSQSDLPLTLSAHLRGYWPEWKTLIDRTLECGAHIVNFVQVAGIERARAPWLTRAETVDVIHRQIEYAKSQGAKTAFGTSAPPRTDPQMVEKVYKAAAEAGVHRVYLYDGRGNLTPEATKYMVRWFRDIVGAETQIAFHGHNDFGLTLANSLAAVNAGCDFVDAVFNGLGDRAGNTPLEELVLSLEVLYGIDTGLDKSMIKPISDLVQEKFKVPVQPNKAIVGRNVYRHATNGHVSVFLASEEDFWFSEENIRPEVLGTKRSLEFGQTCLHTGENAAIATKIRSLGLSYNQEQLKEIVSRIRQIVDNRIFATEEEVTEIIKSVLTNGKA
jgi:isopropylmalate/homocitrate/citramalate synthase